MQKIFINIQNSFINQHYEALSAARDRANAVNTAELTLGEGERQRLLAATGALSINEIINAAFVVKRLKRGALIQVHNLLYFANRYGVMVCLVPAEFCIGGFNAVWGPGIHFAGAPEILAKLGVTQSHSGKSDYLHDYSHCLEFVPDWL